MTPVVLAGLRKSATGLAQRLRTARAEGPGGSEQLVSGRQRLPGCKPAGALRPASTCGCQL